MKLTLSLIVLLILNVNIVTAQKHLTIFGGLNYGIFSESYIAEGGTISALPGLETGLSFSMKAYKILYLGIGAKYTAISGREKNISAPLDINSDIFITRDFTYKLLEFPISANILIIEKEKLHIGFKAAFSFAIPKSYSSELTEAKPEEYEHYWLAQRYNYTLKDEQLFINNMFTLRAGCDISIPVNQSIGIGTSTGLSSCFFQEVNEVQVVLTPYLHFYIQVTPAKKEKAKRES